MKRITIALSFLFISIVGCNREKEKSDTFGPTWHDVVVLKDTVVEVVHDTVYIKKTLYRDKWVESPTIRNKANVEIKTVNQTGGQTAEKIVNNY